jgi:hypothetical protein
MKEATDNGKDSSHSANTNEIESVSFKAEGIMAVKKFNVNFMARYPDRRLHNRIH